MSDLITTETISVADCEAAVSGPDRGAIVSFAGVVRDHDHGRQVVALEYSAHPAAAEALAQVIAETRAREGVSDVCVRHRVGALAIGDTALAAAVSGPHRGDVFAACEWMITEIKNRVPIWKHQTFADGTSEWVNCP